MFSIKSTKNTDQRSPEPGLRSTLFGLQVVVVVAGPHELPQFSEAKCSGSEVTTFDSGEEIASQELCQL